MQVSDVKNASDCWDNFAGISLAMHEPGYQRVNLFIYLEFYIAFNSVQVISRRVVLWAEETSTYSWSRFCTVNCRPTASNYQLSHLRLCREPNPGLRGGRRECYHSATVAPVKWLTEEVKNSFTQTFDMFDSEVNVESFGPCFQVAQIFPSFWLSTKESDSRNFTFKY